MSKFIGEIIKDYRKRKGLSQTVLGDLVGMSAATIHRIEHGEKIPTDAEATLLAEQLGVSTGTILDACQTTREQQPSLPQSSFKTNWQIAHPATYSGPVWIQITPYKESRSVTHHFKIRWNVWERTGTLTFDADYESIYLEHYKHNDGLGMPLFLTLSHPCYVVFGRGEPPEQAIDINFQWIRVEPPPPDQLWRYLVHYVGWFYKRLTQFKR